MLSLDIAVNGDRYCVAGTDDLAMYAAIIYQHDRINAADREKIHLSVFGSEVATHYVRGGAPRALNIGDVITIRVVES